MNQVLKPAASQAEKEVQAPLSTKKSFPKAIIKCRDNLRYWDDDEIDFDIMRGETKQLGAKHLRSLSLRRALLDGTLVLVEGSVTFAYKGQQLTLHAGDKPLIGTYSAENPQPAMDSAKQKKESDAPKAPPVTQDPRQGAEHEQPEVGMAVPSLFE